MPDNRDPQFQFQGTFCTAEIFYMVEDSVISRNEAWLLLTIDGLCNRKTGEDCYASNEHLANRCGINVRNLQKAIAHLKELGLLEETKFDGHRRWLRTHIRNYRRDVENDTSGMSKTTSIKGSKDPKKNKRNPSGSASRNALGVSRGSLGLIDDEGIPQDEISLPVLWSKEYKEGLRACWPSALASNDWKVSNQAKEFAVLLKHEKAIRIDSVLQWFIDHNMGKGGQDGLPSRCRSPASFRKCWDWICEKFDAQTSKDQKAKGLTDSQRAEYQSLSREKTKELAERVQEALQLSWPAKAMKELEPFVAIAAQGYLRFLHWCRDTNQTSIIGWEDQLPDLEEFVIAWCEMVDKQVGSWLQWNGHLDRFQFSPEHEAFGKMLKRWIDISYPYHQKVTAQYLSDIEWRPE